MNWSGRKGGLGSGKEGQGQWALLVPALEGAHLRRVRAQRVHKKVRIIREGPGCEQQSSVLRGPGV